MSVLKFLFMGAGPAKPLPLTTRVDDYTPRAYGLDSARIISQDISPSGLIGWVHPITILDQYGDFIACKELPDTYSAYNLIWIDDETLIIAGKTTEGGVPAHFLLKLDKNLNPIMAKRFYSAQATDSGSSYIQPLPGNKFLLHHPVQDPEGWRDYLSVWDYNLNLLNCWRRPEAGDLFYTIIGLAGDDSILIDVDMAVKFNWQTGTCEWRRTFYYNTSEAQITACMPTATGDIIGCTQVSIFKIAGDGSWIQGRRVNWTTVPLDGRNDIAQTPDGNFVSLSPASGERNPVIVFTEDLEVIGLHRLNRGDISRQRSGRIKCLSGGNVLMFPAEKYVEGKWVPREVVAVTTPTWEIPDCPPWETLTPTVETHSMSIEVHSPPEIEDYTPTVEDITITLTAYTPTRETIC